MSEEPIVNANLEHGCGTFVALGGGGGTRWGLPAGCLAGPGAGLRPFPPAAETGFPPGPLPPGPGNMGDFACGPGCLAGCLPPSPGCAGCFAGGPDGFGPGGPGCLPPGPAGAGALPTEPLPPGTGIPGGLGPRSLG